MAISGACAELAFLCCSSKVATNFGIRPANAGLELRRQKCPVLWQKRVDLISSRRVEACQHVRQIRKRIDFVGDARGDDVVESSQVLARVLVPREQEIFATKDSIRIWFLAPSIEFRCRSSTWATPDLRWRPLPNMSPPN